LYIFTNVAAFFKIILIYEDDDGGCHIAVLLERGKFYPDHLKSPKFHYGVA